MGPGAYLFVNGMWAEVMVTIFSIGRWGHERAPSCPSSSLPAGGPNVAQAVLTIQVITVLWKMAEQGIGKNLRESEWHALDS